MVSSSPCSTPQHKRYHFIVKFFVQKINTKIFWFRLKWSSTSLHAAWAGNLSSSRGNITSSLWVINLWYKDIHVLIPWCELVPQVVCVLVQVTICNSTSGSEVWRLSTSLYCSKTWFHHVEFTPYTKFFTLTCPTCSITFLNTQSIVSYPNPSRLDSVRYVNSVLMHTVSIIKVYTLSSFSVWFWLQRCENENEAKKEWN